jgi:4-hydroxy-3-polyprenylbenzoate decarboxylase
MAGTHTSVELPRKLPTSKPAREYPDLHDHIDALEKAGLLIVVDRPINKDTEMHPLVRWQYSGGIPIEERKAFLFTNITDSKGRKYDVPVLVGGLGTNSAIYSIGMGCEVGKIRGKWAKAMSEPLTPRIVTSAQCQEIVYQGADLRNGHGLDHIPVPISTPGWDNAPYTSTSHFITKDPDTEIQNMGLYRGQIKAPDRLGINTSIELRTGGYMHWEKWKARGEPMPCAVVIGCPPAVTYVSIQKVPENLDELHVAGALLGTPLNVVKAMTVDLLVPAEAEIVVEGFVSTEFLEPEAPFGESHGHVNLQEYNGYLDVTAITRRRNPVITSWMSQLTPSESTATRVPSIEAAHLAHLRNNLGIKGVQTVIAHAVLTGMQKGSGASVRQGHPTDRNLARALWRRVFPEGGRQMDHRRGYGHRWTQRRCHPLGAGISLQAAPRHGHSARQCGLAGDLLAHRHAEARVHGECAQDLGGAWIAAAHACHAVVRLRSGRVERAPGASGAACREGRLLGNRQMGCHTPARQRHRDEH